MTNPINLDDDTRVMQRRLAKGQLAKAAIAETLSALPDVADQAEWLDPSREDEIEAAPEEDADEA